MPAPHWFVPGADPAACFHCKGPREDHPANLDEYRDASDGQPKPSSTTPVPVPTLADALDRLRRFVHGVDAALTAANIGVPGEGDILTALSDLDDLRAALRQHAAPSIAGAMTPDRLREIEGFAAAAVDPDPPDDGEERGPLRLCAEHIRSTDPTPRDILIRDVGAEGAIAHMESDGPDMLAAARLMAAAPELLDEVRRLRAPATDEAVRVEGVVARVAADGLFIVEPSEEHVTHTLKKGDRVEVRPLPATGTKEG